MSDRIKQNQKIEPDPECDNARVAQRRDESLVLLILSFPLLTFLILPISNILHRHVESGGWCSGRSDQDRSVSFRSALLKSLFAVSHLVILLEEDRSQERRP